MNSLRDHLLRVVKVQLGYVETLESSEHGKRRWVFTFNADLSVPEHWLNLQMETAQNFVFVLCFGDQPDSVGTTDKAFSCSISSGTDGKYTFGFKTESDGVNPIMDTNQTRAFIRFLETISYSLATLQASEPTQRKAIPWIRE